ncbi:hypothetical protein POVCU2_0040780 [Plasmodium ovale curtisi]|uniref:Uncharacterized protein n=1 Tax=Plasmodium ovale curtisi TaxID=864141 RepID=A0A1A8W7E5_PLAOA|nr:hypothetical protein POVCU2_0040780 [Plasmodium ovale curtisi]
MISGMPRKRDVQKGAMGWLDLKIYIWNFVHRNKMGVSKSRGKKKKENVPKGKVAYVFAQQIFAVSTHVKTKRQLVRGRYFFYLFAEGKREKYKWKMTNI